MKKLVLISLVLLASSSLFSQSYFGLAGAAGSKSAIGLDGDNLNFGLHARFLNDFSETIGFVGGFTYFLPSSIAIEGIDLDMNYSALNADLVVYLVNEESGKFYALGGANYAFAKASAMGISESNSEVSWELGLGFRSNSFFIEGKYDKNLRQIVAFVGIYF